MELEQWYQYVYILYLFIYIEKCYGGWLFAIEIMKYEFSRNKIKIRPIYLSDELKNYDKTIIISEKIKDVYGIDLKVDNCFIIIL